MADVVRIAMEFTSPSTIGNKCVMTTHVGWANAVSPTSGELDLIADLFRDWWDVGVGSEAALKSLMSTSCRLDRVTAQRIFPEPADVAVELNVSIAGSVSGDMCPPQCCIVISERTNTATRSARGRMYVPGVPISGVGTGGALQSATQTGIADSAKGLIAAIPALDSDWGWIVWSRKLEVGYPITSVRVGNRVDTQRRRRVVPETYVQGA